MELILFFALCMVVLFGFVVFFGAPYLPTLGRQVEEALDLLDLQPGQTLLELGSGDGKMLRAAAKRGITCVGYELNPILVLISKVVTWRYRKLVTVKTANFWSVQWPPADGIYVFLLQKYMSKLDTKCAQQAKEHGLLKLVSFAFTIPGVRIKKTSKGLYYYEYR